MPYSLEISRALIQDFEEKIRFEGILDFIARYYRFNRDMYPSFVRFFQGRQPTIELENTAELEYLQETGSSIMEQIDLSRDLLSTYADWEVVSVVEDIRLQLNDIPVLWKYFKSAKTNFNYAGLFEIGYLTRQGETLEAVANRLDPGGNPNNDWVNIALRNNLTEAEITLDGGQRLQLQIDLGDLNNGVATVMDFGSGERILGLDIDRRTTLVNDDIKVLNYPQTFRQAVFILISLLKGELPEFINMGRNGVGGNFRTFAVSTIVRQITDLLATDDTIANFRLEDVSSVGTDIFIKISVQARTGLIVDQNLSI
jgi:hypothetical protein